jgi:hypothetical protein
MRQQAYYQMQRDAETHPFLFYVPRGHGHQGHPLVFQKFFVGRLQGYQVINVQIAFGNCPSYLPENLFFKT